MLTKKTELFTGEEEPMCANGRGRTSLAPTAQLRPKGSNAVFASQENSKLSPSGASPHSRSPHSNPTPPNHFSPSLGAHRPAPTAPARRPARPQPPPRSLPRPAAPRLGSENPRSVWRLLPKDGPLRSHWPPEARGPGARRNAWKLPERAARPSSLIG